MATLYGIVKAEITYDVEGTPTTVTFDTFSEANIEPKISEGEEKILRMRDKILGVARTEDILYGLNIQLTDNAFSPELIEVVDGGTLQYDAVETTKVIGYVPPKSTDVANRKEFSLTLYCEEKEGETVKQYVKYTFPKCKGRPIGISLKEEEFAVQQFNVIAYETETEPCYKWDYVTSLT